jgi:hypothetical protein
MFQNSHPSAPAGTGFRPSTFSKIFRWSPEPTHAGEPLPASVEIAGSFSGWERLPFGYDEVSNVWQLMLENIPGNHTHSYMILADGQPVLDKNADGLAIPQTFQEKQHQLMTPRGPRVFMLFSQTK